MAYRILDASIRDTRKRDRVSRFLTTIVPIPSTTVAFRELKFLKLTTPKAFILVGLTSDSLIMIDLYEVAPRCF